MTNLSLRAISLLAGGLHIPAREGLSLLPSKSPAAPEQQAAEMPPLPPPDKTRQLARRFLFCVAFSEVTGRNSRQVGKHWFISMARAERRKLARAYAAGEWRRQSPETRDLRLKAA